MKILTPLLTKNIDDDRWVQLTAPFIFESDVLKEAGLKYRITIPTDFVQDFESVPAIRGRNKRGGTVHDYFSCFDSNPVVTKGIAAACYLEMCAYCDAIDHTRSLVDHALDFARRWSKVLVVRVWPCYFHKRSVSATIEEITGMVDDPYVTAEKLDALIEKQEAVTEGIKDAPVEQTPDLVEASEQITEDLKDAKAEATTNG